MSKNSKRCLQLLFLLLGWEQAHLVPGPNPFMILSLDAFPFSHSLVALLAWGVLFALVYRMRTGSTQGAVVVALLVLSHWVLDFVTHRPDMPLYPGGPKVGLGLWNSVVGTVTVEGLMFVAGTWIYLTTTRARDALGRWGLLTLLAALVLSYVGALVGGAPPSMRAIEIGGIVFGWLFVAWAAWADRHRDVVTIAAPPGSAPQP